MLAKEQDKGQYSLFFSLESTLDGRHPLFVLSHKVDWEIFEREFSSLYAPDSGRPAKPIRLMAGLLILKHLRNLSDEGVTDQWSENIYFQYFCGEQTFRPCVPCEGSELSHFRNRIGENGAGLIFKEIARINWSGADDSDTHEGTTDDEKGALPLFAADDRLTEKMIRRYLKIARKNYLELRRSYTRTLKKLSKKQTSGKQAKKSGKG